MTKRIRKNEDVHAVMYIFLNKGLGMSTGKAAAQAAHAGVEAYKISKKSLIDQWELGGHYTKLVMEAKDTTHMLVIRHYISCRGFKVVPIIDEGMTEVEPHSMTALGVEVVNKLDAQTQATFETFKLYRDDKKHWWNRG